MSDLWRDPVLTPPKNNETYLCQIVNNDRHYVAKRIYKNGHWFGGARPFTDNEKVIGWQFVEKTQEQKNDQ